MNKSPLVTNTHTLFSITVPSALTTCAYPGMRAGAETINFTSTLITFSTSEEERRGEERRGEERRQLSRKTSLLILPLVHKNIAYTGEKLRRRDEGG